MNNYKPGIIYLRKHATVDVQRIGSQNTDRHGVPCSCSQDGHKRPQTEGNGANRMHAPFSVTKCRAMSCVVLIGKLLYNL
jgi:hypothetical protein